MSTTNTRHGILFFSGFTPVMLCGMFYTLLVPCSTIAHTRNGTVADPEDIINLDIEDLLNIEISTVSNRPETIRETPSNITIVTDEQIKEWGSRHLKDVLRRVPGYNVVADRDEWCFSARGSISDNNQKYLILIDGHRMSSIDNFGPGQIIELPNDLSNVKQIEIIRGPGSAIWGSGALAGVINIITKDAYDLGDKKHHASFTIGEDETYKTNLQIGREYEQGDWIFHGSFVRSDGTRITQSAATSSFPILDTTTGFSSHPFGTYRTALNKYDPGFMIHFKGRYDRFFFNALTFQTSVFNRHYEIGQGRRNFLSTEKYFLETGFNDQFGDWDFTWKGSLHYNLAQYENTEQAANAVPSFLEKEWKDKFAHTGVTIKRDFTDQLAFNAGLEYTYTRTGPDDAKQTTPDGTVTRSTAHFMDNDLTGYVVFDYYLRSNLKLVLGTGINYNDDRGSDTWALNPRAGVIWHASDTSTHKFLYNHAFLRPATFQASNNSQVDSEEMDQFEYIYMKKFGQASLVTTVYWQKLEGVINILSLGSGTTQFNNAGDVESKGIEVEFTTPLEEDHTLWVNASYGDAEGDNFPATLPLNSQRVNASNKILSHPEFTMNAGATFRFFDRKFFVSPAIRHVATAEYRATPPTTSLSDALYRNVGPFTYLDLNLGYEPNPNLGFYLTFHNLTDIDSRNHLSIWNGTLTQPGRYIEFKMALKF